MGLATGSGWGSQPEAGLSGHGLGPAGSHSCLIPRDSGSGPASVPLLEDPPQGGGGRWGDQEWGVPRAQQRPGSNPDTGPASYRAREKSPFHLPGTRRTGSSAC